MASRRGVAVAVLVLFALLGVWGGSYVFSYHRLFSRNDPLVVSDVSRLTPTRVAEVDRPKALEEIQKIIRMAHEKGLKVSIAGSHHSQGGHIVTPGGVVLDMRSFNRVLKVDEKSKTVTVESGARWADVQRELAPHRLAVKVMQSSYVFTVGGTLSADAHGRDLDQTSVVETVKSFHLLKPDGAIVNVSRTENPELFRLVIGGYGLFGVILDVDLEVVEDELYERRAEVLDYHDFPAYFEGLLRRKSEVALMLARPSIDPKSFLREMIVTTWNRTSRPEPPGLRELTEEQGVLFTRFFFGLSSDFDWAKSLRWSLQKRIESSPGKTVLITRNNSMRPPAAAVDFLYHENATTTDIIQEYYVPTHAFVPFMDEFRRILVDGKMDVISSTVRYVRANDETYLAYAPHEDAFAIIQMSTVGLDRESQDHAERVTQQLVDAALRFGGSYYLTYQLYPTADQLRRAYPNAPLVFRKKRELDPGELFSNHFYEKYAPALVAE